MRFQVALVLVGVLIRGTLFVIENRNRIQSDFPRLKQVFGWIGIDVKDASENSPVEVQKREVTEQKHKMSKDRVNNKKHKVEELRQERRAELFGESCRENKVEIPQKLSFDALLGRADELASPVEQSPFSYIQRSMFIASARSECVGQDLEVGRVNERLTHLADEIVRASGFPGGERGIMEAVGNVKHLHQALISQAAQITTIPTTFNSSDGEVTANETRKIEEMTNLFDTLRTGYRDMMSRVSSEVVGILGASPFKFAHIDSGHPVLADEVLHDEFNRAVIINGPKTEQFEKYITFYGVLYDVVLMNSGDAELRLSGVETDKQFQLYDNYKPWKPIAPEGMDFKISSPFILPTGSWVGKNCSLPVIASSDVLDVAVKEALHGSVFVGGDRSVFTELIGMFSAQLGEYYRSEVGRNQWRETLKEDQVRYGVSVNSGELLGSIDTAKQFILSSLPKLIPHLQMGAEKLQMPVFDLIAKLPVSERAKHNLRYSISLAREAKLKLYLKSDIVSTLSKFAAQPIIDAIGKKGLVDFIEIGVGLGKALNSILDGGDTAKLSAIGHLESRNQTSLNGEILFFLQDFEGARECLKLALKGTDDPRELANRNELIGKSWIQSLKFNNARRYYEHAVQYRRQVLSDDPIVRWEMAGSVALLAQCLIEINTADAKAHLIEAEEIYEEIKEMFPQKYLKGVADITDSMGWMYFKEKNYQKSLESYEKSQKHFDEFYSGEINHDTIKTRNGMALCYRNLEKYQEALDKYKDILKMKRQLIGKETADVNVASYLRFMGECNKALQRYDEAEANYKESIAVRKCALGSDGERRCSVATTICKLSDMYIRTKSWVKAAESALEAFKLAKGAIVFRNGPIIMIDAVQLIVQAANGLMGSKEGTDGLEMEAIVHCVRETMEELKNKEEEGFINARSQLEVVDAELNERFAEPMEQSEL